MNRTRSLLALAAIAATAHAASAQAIDPAHAFCWGENIGWLNWTGSTQTAALASTYLHGFVWAENIGWVNLGHTPADGLSYQNLTGDDAGVNLDPSSGYLSGFAWSENAGWINFSGGALASPPQPARLDYQASRFRGWAWAENLGWINLDDGTVYVGVTGLCQTSDFNGDGDIGTDADIEAFFACLGGTCCPTCGTSDFNGDGDIGTDADIEAFFRVLAGGTC